MNGHNHTTRDIKAPGLCPACDRQHAMEGDTVGKLTPVRAVRLLRAKAGEMENWVLHNTVDESHVWQLTADIALLFAIMADFMERTEVERIRVGNETKFIEGFEEGRPDGG